MAIALASLKRRLEALQSYPQAQQICESLNLDFRAEQCQSAIAQLQKRSRFPWWGWFWVGVAIVLATLAVSAEQRAWWFNK